MSYFILTLMGVLCVTVGSVWLHFYLKDRYVPYLAMAAASVTSGLIVIVINVCRALK